MGPPLRLHCHALMARRSAHARSLGAGQMSQASSARSRRSSAGARVLPAPTVDHVTGLPLIHCPECREVRLIALTVKHTKNRGKRFFKCPRNKQWVPRSCPICTLQPQYEEYLEEWNFSCHPCPAGSKASQVGNGRDDGVGRDEELTA